RGTDLLAGRRRARPQTLTGLAFTARRRRGGTRQRMIVDGRSPGWTYVPGIQPRPLSAGPGMVRRQLAGDGHPEHPQVQSLQPADLKLVMPGNLPSIRRLAPRDPLRIT